MVPDNSTGIPRAPAYSGGISPQSHDFAYGAVTLCGRIFQSFRLSWSCGFADAPITPPMRRHTGGLGSSPFARHYSGNRVYFLFLTVLRCFSSRRSPPALQDMGIAPHGLPHSDIRASTGICPSARLFAAYHVLLRLREPRHPPCALLSLRCFFQLHACA